MSVYVIPPKNVQKLSISYSERDLGPVSCLVVILFIAFCSIYIRHTDVLCTVKQSQKSIIIQFPVSRYCSTFASVHCNNSLLQESRLILLSFTYRSLQLQCCFQTFRRAMHDLYMDIKIKALS